MSEMMKFTNEQFGTVRTIEEDGKILFCAKDVAIALGYKDTTNAIKQHCRGVVKHHLIDSLGRSQETNFIPEGDIYRLVIGSALPGAEKFEAWIFDEVLPSIRKTGGYISGQESLSPAELMAKALLVAQRTLDEREARLIALAAENQKLLPKATYCDMVLQTKNAVPITQIAKDYGMSAIKLNKLLHDLKVQYKIDKCWVLYQDYADKGYTKSMTHVISEDKSIIHTYWTQTGRLFLYELLKEKCGILPIMEKNAA
nr:MAG TPA: repressor domain protein [Caudoviricetes sp.]